MSLQPTPVYSPFPTAMFDLPEYVGRPHRVYAIAATERSGSTLLCRELARTGLLGLPANYLHIEWSREILKRGLKGATLLDTLYRLRSTPNGCFGIKFHHPTKDITHADFEGWEPDTWLFCRRQDKLSQAISWSIATQTNSWWSNHPEQWEPDYDFNNILSILRVLSYEDRIWDERLNDTDVPVHEVIYGDERMENLIPSLLTNINPPMGKPYVFPFPQLAKQRGERSELWAEKFLFDAGRYGLKVEKSWGKDLLDQTLLPLQVTKSKPLSEQDHAYLPDASI